MGIFDEIAERKVKEAVEKKEFDGQEELCKPINDNACFSVDSENRLSFHIMKNALVQPEEIQLKKEIISLNIRFREELTKEEKESLLLKRSELLTQLDVLLEKYRKK